MSNCIIIGDSIGVGVADIRADCTAYVQSGINSRDWNRRWRDRDLTASVLVISLGSNDLGNIRSDEELRRIRLAAGDCSRVLWILPAIKPRVREIIIRIADAYGDDILELVSLSADGVHPTGAGYRALAGAIK